MKSTHFSSLLRTYWLWPAIMLGGVLLIALLPGGFAEKSKLLLHGLCAQTPDHTFAIGGQPLPFDARMTGIYSGVVGAVALLAIRGRLLSQQMPSMKIMAVLVLFVAAMAADGFNSLLTDLNLWHPWTTTNTTRVITGYGAGVALAIALVWLLGGTVFQIADRAPILAGWRDLAGTLVFLPVGGLLLWVAPGWLYVPYATLLVLSAWTVLGTLATVTLLLATRRDEHIVSRPMLHIPGAVGLVLGLIVMLLLSSGRQWLEAAVGITSTL